MADLIVRFPISRPRDVVDIASRESFPASDPPSWTPVMGSGNPGSLEMTDDDNPTTVEPDSATNSNPKTKDQHQGGNHDP